MDAAEHQIKELREDLNQRFDQLVEMIRKGVTPATNEGDSSKEEEYAHQRRRDNLGAKTATTTRCSTCFKKASLC